MNVNNKDQEIATLARTLRQSRLASSESEAMRMAEEMLNTSKKVHDDFAERDKKLYGVQKSSNEVENAHKMMEAITQNMAKGKADVRINIAQMDINKPLKDIVGEEERVTEMEDDDDAVEIKSGNSHEPVASDDDNFDEDDDDSEEEKALPEMPPIAEADAQTPESEAAEEEDFSVKELEQ